MQTKFDTLEELRAIVESRIPELPLVASTERNGRTFYGLYGGTVFDAKAILHAFLETKSGKWALQQVGYVGEIEEVVSLTHVNTDVLKIVFADLLPETP